MINLLFATVFAVLAVYFGHTLSADGIMYDLPNIIMAVVLPLLYQLTSFVPRSFISAFSSPLINTSVNAALLRATTFFKA